MVTAGFTALRCHPGWAGPCILYLRGAHGLASLPRESHVEESSRGCGTYRGLCSARRVSRGSPHWWGWDALGGTRAGAGPGHGVPNPLRSCWVHGLGLLRDTRGSCVGLELVHFFLFMLGVVVVAATLRVPGEDRMPPVPSRVAPGEAPHRGCVLLGSADCACPFLCSSEPVKDVEPQPR